MLLNHNRNKKIRIKCIHDINNEEKPFRNTLENCDIFLSTPLKFLKKIKRDKELNLSKLQYVVIDEVDKFFEFGLVR